jgi:hypothetical protein
MQRINYTHTVLVLAVMFATAMGTNSALGQSYEVETINVPKDIRLEVGGMGFWDDGTLVMCTRRGEVWKYKDGGFQQFAFGLHEPLGLWPGKQGEIWVIQRGEVTHVLDTDNDGKADRFDTINQGWGYTGNYHQYAFGLERDKKGNFYGTLGLGFMNGGDRFKGRWLGTRDEIKYRGWVIKITPEGKLIPYASGLRAPNGITIDPDGEIFTTDNQGSYIACGWLMHVREGDFVGHPSGLVDDPRYSEPWTFSREKLLSMRKRPAVFLPHGTMGNSTSKPIWDTTDGRFGPFAGQTLIGDVQTGKISRVVLEKVDGEYQGACIPFIFDRLGGGVNRLIFDKQGVLWAGFTGRGWAAGEGLKKITYTGKVPHEIYSMNLTKTGFQLTFTKPVDKTEAAKVGNYSLRHFDLAWHAGYGTGPSKAANVTPNSAKVSSDGRVVTLELPEMLNEKIYELHLTGLAATDGSKLEHPTAFYTLNRLKQ